MTSNIAESLNNALKAARSSHIMELLKFIRAMITHLFNARRTKALKHRWEVTPEVDKEIRKRRQAVEGSRVGCVSSWGVKVVGKFNGKHHVLLEDKKCNCKQFDRL
ncbi:hypothetical protein V5N11_002996 [Cardamine amara subsp. amara]|uniref:Uncharacterized protein n=1 Tax=Cardamine amara subsp. amara TaxID=228776 RepID=A0ABD1ABG3_CARAN